MIEEKMVTEDELPDLIWANATLIKNNVSVILLTLSDTEREKMRRISFSLRAIKDLVNETLEEIEGREIK